MGLLAVEGSCIMGLFAAAELLACGVDKGDWANGIVKSWVIVAAFILGNHCAGHRHGKDVSAHACAFFVVLMMGVPLLPRRRVSHECPIAALWYARCVLGFICTGLWTLAALLDDTAPELILITSALGFLLSSVQIILVVSSLTKLKRP